LLSKVFNSSKGRQVWPQRTICEVNRTIYDWCVCHLTPEQLQDVVPLLEETYLLGIKLVKKLVDHKLAMPEWAENNRDEAAKLRLARIEMEAHLETGRRVRSE